MESSPLDLRLISDRQYLIDILLDKHSFVEKVLTNASFVNVLTKEIYEADIAIAGPYILMVGDCEKLIGPKTEIIDVTGKYVTPGFIDAHLHFENSMLTITEFTRLSLPSGTTCIISDPHEIVNVLGCVGIKALFNEAEHVPQHIFFRIPALIPNSPGLETAGYTISSKDLPRLLNEPQVLGIGETHGINSIQCIYECNRELIRDTICSGVLARKRGCGVDGSASGLSDHELAAQIITGGTDVSCHATTNKEEAIKKIRNGVFIILRDGTTHNDIDDCIKVITEEKIDSRRILLAADNLSPKDLLKHGHMDYVIKKAIRCGINPIEAIQMATINTASWFGLSNLGALSPGKYADLNIINGPLEEMKVEQVFINGRREVLNGKLCVPLQSYSYPKSCTSSVKTPPITKNDLCLSTEKDTATARCIGIINNQSLTDAIEIELEVHKGLVKPNLHEDILPIAVVGRHNQNSIGKAFVKGFKMKRGAIAESISHDTHNIIVLGTNFEDMALAVNKIIEIQGGLAAVCDGKRVEYIPLPIAGLMTDLLNARELAHEINTINEFICNDLGCEIDSPFLQLSYLSLSTSPKWKISDRGLIDVSNYRIIPAIK